MPRYFQKTFKNSEVKPTDPGDLLEKFEKQHGLKSDFHKRHNFTKISVSTSLC